MNHMYSRVQIPKSLSQGDISELFIIDHQHLADFGKTFRIAENFKPVNKKVRPSTDFLKTQATYVKHAMDLQANLALIDGQNVTYMMCQEQKKAGLVYVGIGVGAVIYDEEKGYYLVQRGELCSSRIGEWESPGGTQEHGESLFDAAEREALEETGLFVAATGVVSVAEEFVNGQQWINFGILCKWFGKIDSNHKTEKGKIADQGWYTWDQLPEKMSKGAYKVIKDHQTGIEIPIRPLYK